MDFELKIRDQLDIAGPAYGLATANILYRMPDHPGLLQTFVWQFQDFSPDYPRLEKFLDYWSNEIDAAIHSVEVAHKRLASAHGVRPARCQLNIH
jgi:uncharacterized protein Usg